VVVHHDAAIARAVDSRHVGRKLAETAWSELQRVELVTGIFMPSLAQVLSAIADRAMVYVEIKGTAIEALAIETIRRGPARCAVHSFDHDSIRRCAQIAPEIPRGILFEDEPIDVVATMAAAGARDVWPHWRLVDANLVASVHAKRGRVIAWTVNAPDVASSLLALGVDGICTDDVRLVDSALRDSSTQG
jgi:glycerophosphoryl diester phosphodiesterase